MRFSPLFGRQASSPSAPAEADRRRIFRAESVIGVYRLLDYAIGLART